MRKLQPWPDIAYILYSYFLPVPILTTNDCSCTNKIENLGKFSVSTYILDLCYPHNNDVVIEAMISKINYQTIIISVGIRYIGKF